MDPAIEFARGTKLRREGRAPYLHILKWLAESSEWSIQLNREVDLHQELKGSVSQVIQKGYLKNLIQDSKRLTDLFHYDSESTVLSVEDPQFIFFIRNLIWNKFAERVGYKNVHFETRYDFALSFSGSDREHAENLFDELADRELEVFYDKNEQHRILAEPVEEYLAPIYRSEAKYVVCLLGPDYPNKVWTKFESEQFKHRFGEGSVIPIWFENAQPSLFDKSRKVGGITFDPSADAKNQISQIADTLSKKMVSDRSPTP